MLNPKIISTSNPKSPQGIEHACAVQLINLYGCMINDPIDSMWMLPLIMDILIVHIFMDISPILWHETWTGFFHSKSSF